jgi:hypothetical protein
MVGVPGRARPFSFWLKHTPLGKRGEGVESRAKVRVYTSLSRKRRMTVMSS